MLLLQLGFMGGWASPTLARLSAPDSPVPLNPEQASWVASLVNFSRFFGGILGAVLTSYLGSKRAILATLFPIALGWLLVALANAVEWLYVARLCSGLGLGMGFSAFPLYIGEVSMPEIRGALVSLATVGAPVGQVVASICGSYLSISTAAYIYFALAVFLMGLFSWLPESPHHLIKIGNSEAARRSIDWYRAGREVETELNAVEKFVDSDGTTNFIDKLRDFKSPPIRRATFHIIALFSFMQIGGLNIVMFFMETILIRANFTLIAPSEVVIYVNIGATVASVISIFLIDRCGRRFLLLVASAGTTASMVGLMIYFLLSNMTTDVQNLQWLPVVSLFLFMVSFFLGLMPVPNAILSEIFPANIKCVAACIAILTGAATSFLSAKTYQPMVDLIGDAYVFMIYAICSVIVIPYTLFLMPETKGKSLQQIQNELMPK